MASLKSLCKSPSTVIFSIAFPLVFIVVFGFIGNQGNDLKVILSPDSDTNNYVYQGLQQNNVIFKAEENAEKATENVVKKNAVALLTLKEKDGHFDIDIQSTLVQSSAAAQLKRLINEVILEKNPKTKTEIEKIASIQQAVISSREYKQIDFILPGQLGFSLLAASVFGTAFVFFHMRQMLVLKRFFATPIKKSVILLSEGTARLIFQLLGALLLITVGAVAFDFTLIHGAWTVFQMLFVSGIALLVFMSFGFIISGIAKNDATIPPLANMFTMPQFLLAGTFFPIDVLPEWLGFFAKLMPLAFFNDAVRGIAFDGLNLWDVKIEILALCIWGVIGYAAASKLFKWE